MTAQEDYMFQKLLLPIILLFSFQSQAWLSVMDTADLIDSDDYNITLEGQIIAEDDTGANLNAKLETSFMDEFSLSAELGFGHFDFYGGAAFKWAPVPDIKGHQPALSISGGLYYTVVDSENILTFRAEPIVSKKFDTHYGVFNPYASLPINFLTFDNETEVGTQFVIGTHFQERTIENFTFYAEAGFDISDTFNYFSVGLLFKFDKQYGFIWE